MTADRAPSAGTPGVSLYAGIFLATLSSLVFEIALTKIFSVTLWYHFAYLAVSLALFGLGAGGLVAFFQRDRLTPRFPGILRYLALLQGAGMVGSLILVLGTSLELTLDPSHIVILLITGLAYVICAVPFFFVGMILALVMRHASEQVPRIYFADLAGSAAGCLVFVALAHLFSGPAVVLVAAGLTLVASFFLGGRRSLTGPRRFVAGGLAVAAVAVCVVLHQGTRLFTVKYTKSYEEKKDVLYEKWSPLARITVHPDVFWWSDHENPFGWGMSEVWEPAGKTPQMWIQQDACAGTPITGFSGDLSKVSYLRYDITNLVYLAREETRSSFVIGPGGGRDVLAALYFGVDDILACEINPVIVDLVRNRYRDFAGDVYDRPEVRVIVGEGRSTIRRQAQRFDVVMISLIDSWAATAAGAFVLAENYLYTVQAFVDYLEHLTDDGYLSVTRYLFMPRNQTLRVAVVARRALEKLGVERPGDHVAVVGTREDQGMATLLVKRTPFTSAEVDRLAGAVRDLRFVPLYLPGREELAGRDDDFVQALTAHPLGDWLDQEYYDLRPATDDWPFFFQMMYFSHVADMIFKNDEVVGQTFNYRAPLVLLGLLFIASILVLEFYVLPLSKSRRVGVMPRGWGIYFALIGIAFMFVEIPLLQKGALYLGHPTYSLTVVLFSMLIAAGLGSSWCGRHPAESLRRYLAATVVLVVVVVLGTEGLVRWTIGLPLLAKVPLFVLVVAPAAFFMGMALPSGMRLLGRRRGDAIPWVWALNGGASVLGSVLAMTLSMAMGYRFTLTLGGLTYLAALVMARRAIAAPEAEVAAAAVPALEAPP